MAGARSVIGGPDEYGGYDFDDGAGGQLYAYGPEAAQLASSLQAAAVPDMRTAQASPQLAAGVDAVFAPYQQGAAPPPVAAPPADVAPQPQPVPGPSPIQAERDRYISAPVSYGGRPGNVAYALERGAQQVEVPVSFQRAGGTPDLPDGADLRADISIDQQLAAQDRAGLEIAKADEAEFAARFAHQEAARKEYDQRRRVNEQERDYRMRSEEVRQLREDFATKKIDSHRAFGGPLSLGGIVAALAQGMGAYASAMGAGPNYANEIIDGAIARDIQAQQQEIDTARGEVDNALSALTRQFGDAQLARDALELIQRDVALAQAQEIAAGSKRDDVLAALQEYQAHHQAKREEIERRIYQDAMGKQSISGAMDLPMAPTRGGSRAPTYLERLKRGTQLGQAEMAYNAAAAGAEGEVDPLAMRTLEQTEAAKARGKAAGTPEIEDLKLVVPGVGRALTPADATKLKDMADSRDVALKNLAELEALIAKSGTRVPSAQDNERAKALRQDMLILTAQGYGGIITESDLMAAGLQVPDPTSFRPGREREKIRVLRDKIETGWKTQVKNRTQGGLKNLEGAPTPMKR